MATRWERVQAFRARHAKKEIALFLGVGFLWDVTTLGRIDDATTLLSQLGYLSVLGWLLALDERWSLGASPPRFFAGIWTLKEDILHFLFGALLSCYAIFYFKSSSGPFSLLFIVGMFAVLILNELPRFRSRGHRLRIGLFSFCLTSWFAYLLPVLFGFVGLSLFLGAVLLSFLPIAGLYAMIRRAGGGMRQAFKNALMPAILVQGMLIGLYLAGAIPPVPLAIQEIGIYHGVEKDGADWMLLRRESSWTNHFRPTRYFQARPGDRVYCFVRVFAPRAFRDRIRLRWSYRDPVAGWQTWDSIPLTIQGGREGGFRGYAWKEHYTPGVWSVQIETADGREIGSVKFRILEDGSVDERVFETDPA